MFHLRYMQSGPDGASSQRGEKEIAEILGISRGASEVRLSRAMKRLREELEP